MEGSDSMGNSNNCVVQSNDERGSKMENKIIKAVLRQNAIFDKFLEIDNRLDQTNEEEEEDSEQQTKRRKKRLGHRAFEFRHASAKACLEDLEEIFGGQTECMPRRRVMDLKRNDAVACILGRKKYKGNVFQVSPKGVVIKTRDRKKIKLLWENIDGESIQIIKIKNPE